MMSTALHARRHRAARYTSPHLERLEERFVIDEREVATPELRDAAAAVQRTPSKLLVVRGHLHAPPTFFECATAIAFELFRRAGVAIAVLEVGLGGRLDATNVVSPIAAAITSIDFDHQAQLGDTLESIAAEKAGIIKPGIPVVCGPLPPEADRVIAETCRARGARLVRALDRVPLESRHRRRRDDLSASGRRRATIESIELALPGRHQIANAAVVVACSKSFRRQVARFRDDGDRAGLTKASTGPGAWNGCTWQAPTCCSMRRTTRPARAPWRRYLGEERMERRATLVFGAMRDKDVDGILAPLPSAVRRASSARRRRRRARCRRQSWQRSARAMLRPAARSNRSSDPAAALHAACLPGWRVVVAGSIFLVGPLRGILR